MGISDTHEPAPVPNKHEPLWPMVMQDLKEMLSSKWSPNWGTIGPIVLDDMAARHREGVRKYGTPLQTFNGRNPLVDAYQEVLDGIVYLKQAIEEDRKRGGTNWAMYYPFYTQMIAMAVGLRQEIR